MVNPAKVLSFLDIFGRWDPSLALVLGTAVGTSAIGFYMARRRSRPLLAPEFRIPTRRDIDLRLIGGAAIFGVGWGLVGFCPGPSLTALSYGMWQVATFVVAMAVGMFSPCILRKDATRLGIAQLQGTSHQSNLRSCAHPEKEVGIGSRSEVCGHVRASASGRRAEAQRADPRPDEAGRGAGEARGLAALTGYGTFLSTRLARL